MVSPKRFFAGYILMVASVLVIIFFVLPPPKWLEPKVLEYYILEKESRERGIEGCLIHVLVTNEGKKGGYIHVYIEMDTTSGYIFRYRSLRYLDPNETKTFQINVGVGYGNAFIDDTLKVWAERYVRPCPPQRVDV